MTNQKINEAVDEIVSDLSDRRGLGNEWEAIDEDIQDEIKESWKRILTKHLGTNKEGNE